MGGFIFGALGGLMIALSFAKYENQQQFRWTIKLVCFGVGVGLLAKTSSLGGMIAYLIVFPITFGFIGIVIDFIKNQNASAKSTEQKAIEASNKNTTTTTISSIKTERVLHSLVRGGEGGGAGLGGGGGNS